MKSLTAGVFFMVTCAAIGQEPLAEVLKSSFARWDSNHDQAVSLAEADHAIASASVKGDEAAAVVALRRAVSKKKLSSSTLPAAIQNTDIKPFYEAAQKRIVGTNRQLFVNPEPQPQLMRQGKIGDCFCLAAMRTFAQRSPSELTRLIKANEDGSYSVTLGDKIIRTLAPTDGEIALGASTEDGLWAVVYEKAVGISRIKTEQKDATPFNVVTKGGSAGAMMSILTKSEIKRWSCKEWRDASGDESKQEQLLANLRAQLKSAIQEKRLITGGTGPLPKDKARVPGILFNHGYAVLAYDPKSDKARLWNPHGSDFTPKGEEGLKNGYTAKRGEFSVPVTDLVTFFGGFAFQQPPK